MKTYIKQFVKRHYFLFRICNSLVKPFIRIKNMRGVKVENKGVGSLVIDNVGTANSIYASEGSFFDKTRIHICGHSRINPPKSVVVGSHVWIAPNSKIMKGADIGDGAIIGSNTIVTKPVPANTLVVGAPAKVVKENVMWTREKLF